MTQNWYRLLPIYLLVAPSISYTRSLPMRVHVLPTTKILMGNPDFPDYTFCILLQSSLMHQFWFTSVFHSYFSLLCNIMMLMALQEPFSDLFTFVFFHISHPIWKHTVMVTWDVYVTSWLCLYLVDKFQKFVTLECFLYFA